MSDTLQPAEKRCRVCGRDCSTAARMRNTKGEYFCKPCHDALVARSATERSDASDRPGDDAGSDRKLFTEKNALVSCPKCERLSPKQTVVCTSCGYNWGTSDQLAVQELHDDPPTERPGTDLRNENLTKREQAARAMWRHEHFKAIGLIIVGLIGTTIVMNLLGDEKDNAFFGRYFIGFGINWFVGIGAFWLCSIMFLGADSPFQLSAIRLGAAYAISDLAFYGSAPFITPLLGFFVMLACYISLLMTLFELELTDAAMLAVSLFAVKLVIYLVTAMLIFGPAT